MQIQIEIQIQEELYFGKTLIYENKNMQTAPQVFAINNIYQTNLFKVCLQVKKQMIYINGKDLRI